MSPQATNLIVCLPKNWNQGKARMGTSTPLLAVCLPKNWNQGKAYFYEESRESTAYLSRWKMGIELVVRLFWVTML